MNSGTMVGSLIFAVVLVLVLAVVIQLMVRGWRRRAEQQVELVGDLPDLPDEVGAASISTPGLYIGCTLSPAWNDRVAVGDLGYRSKAVLTRYPEGILLERVRAQPIWIPTTSISDIRCERSVVGKVGPRNSILAIRWRLPSGTEIDTGFRANNRDDYAKWLEEEAA